jgi:hypothetical protein
MILKRMRCLGELTFLKFGECILDLGLVVGIFLAFVQEDRALRRLPPNVLLRLHLHRRLSPRLLLD